MIARTHRMLAIGSGGAAGASLRWLVSQSWPVTATAITDGAFPWPVLIINLVGSGVLGFALAEQWRHPRHQLALHDWVGVGFCGGLTTMSTFAVETAQLLRSGHLSIGVLYLLGSVLGAVAAAVLGALAGRQILALLLPVEGRNGIVADTSAGRENPASTGLRDGRSA
ncbi:MAG: CrcB family protein [Acidimicrobiales bacterium]|nr:CrcB family protein [Acidimicrobiales bacterium]